ncbi:MAG: hypothetical protein HZB46_17485 [Solirubrobacterales bacterium]|nr:hypothetical protein [Solirubrobacterales bacterium]
MGRLAAPRNFRLLVLLTYVVGGGLTVLVAVTPGLRFAYRSEEAHVALETAAGLIVGVAAYLVVARFRLSGARSDLVLATGLGVLAVTNLLFAAVPQTTGIPPDERAWAATFAGLLGTVLIALSALAPGQRLPDRRQALLRAWAAAGLVLAAIASAVLIAGDGLPAPVDPALSPETSATIHLTGNAVVLATFGIGAVLLAVAAGGFLRQAAVEHDELRGWLAVAVALGALSRVNYLLFPSRFSDWVTTGDVLRLLFYLAVLGAVLREIAGYQPALARAAIFDERRRLARDLHDGLAQELAFIASQARSLVQERGGDPDLEHIADAARRGLEESRLAITALSRPPDEPLPVLLAGVAEALATRAGSALTLDLDEDVEADQQTRETLLRILREAMTNAVRHGCPSAIEVGLRGGSELRLWVVDDGFGFDPEAGAAAGGLGLTSMRERAEALGGRLALESVPGAGTRVEAALPR